MSSQTSSALGPGIAGRCESEAKPVAALGTIPSTSMGSPRRAAGVNVSPHSFDPDPPSEDEIREAAALKYGAWQC